MGFGYLLCIFNFLILDVLRRIIFRCGLRPKFLPVIPRHLNIGSISPLALFLFPAKWRLVRLIILSILRWMALTEPQLQFSKGVLSLHPRVLRRVSRRSRRIQHEAFLRQLAYHLRVSPQQARKEVRFSAPIWMTACQTGLQRVNTGHIGEARKKRVYPEPVSWDSHALFQRTAVLLFYSFLARVKIVTKSNWDVEDIQVIPTSGASMPASRMDMVWFARPIV